MLRYPYFSGVSKQLLAYTRDLFQHNAVRHYAAYHVIQCCINNLMSCV